MGTETLEATLVLQGPDLLLLPQLEEVREEVCELLPLQAVGRLTWQEAQAVVVLDTQPLVQLQVQEVTLRLDKVMQEVLEATMEVAGAEAVVALEKPDIITMPLLIILKVEMVYNTV